jgi:hypothetical protein
MSATSLDRRSFIAAAGASGAALALYSRPVAAQPARAGATSLAGEWRFALDREDKGVDAQWYGRDLASDAHISLPGILQTQGYGDEITAETQFIAALPRDMRWYLLPQYKEYTVPGNVQVPYLSQPVRHFLGVAWYQRDIEVPAGWTGKRLHLFLERTRWVTEVYVDDRKVGSCRSLVAPHEYDLGMLTPGKHRLSIRIDNRMQQPTYRADGHAVSDALGSTWNGIVGRIELSATSPVYVDDAQVFPDMARKTAQVRVKIGNATGRSGSGTVSAGGVSAPVSWTADGGTATLDVPMSAAAPWSEFNPALQRLTVTLAGADADDRRDLSFGMREIRTDGDHFMLNGLQMCLRTTHDGGGFPLTGYPATDVETWRHIIGICQKWGLNGMRFHSWCPPEAAFIAADELGFYLQPEAGMWNSFDEGGQMLAVLHDETARMVRAYGNHPSFLMMSATNEPAGRYQEQLPGWEQQWRKTDGRRLYTDGTGRYARPPGGPGTPFAGDYIIGGPRGNAGWYGADYEEGLQRAKAGVKIPALAHEIGQYASYPDFAIIDKFNGKGRYPAFPKGIGWGDVPYMHPGNYIIMRDAAARHGLLARNKEIAYASGRFQAICYKEEIEANMRTPSYSGYQMLDLHDYLGQGGALVGLLDAFWEEKGYIKADEFRQYVNTTVPLVRLKQRMFKAGETLTCDAELAHFGETALDSITPVWRILNDKGRTVLSGALPVRPAPRGKNIPLGTITADLSRLPAPAHYRLVLELKGTKFLNNWSFWVYPAQLPAAPADVLVTASWDEAKASLARGGKVLLLAKPDAPSPELALSRTPIFWNRLMNPNRTWMLGLMVDAKHGALAGFPSDVHCDTQWADLLPGTTALNVDSLPAALRPVVQPIDDWNRNVRMAMLFECAVGAGKLMIAAFDFSDAGLGKHAGAPSLKSSVLSYMGSPKFKPRTAISAAELDAWMAVRYVAPAMIISPPATGDVADPNQTPAAAR